MNSDAVLVLVVAAALGFGFSNGFHDTFDVISTAISSGGAPPQLALALAAVLNFLGAFLSVAVAATMVHDIVDAAAITANVVFAGLIGAIAWNLATWYLSFPSSSSHALIGGLVGATLAAAGTGAVEVGGLLEKVLLPALLAPLLAFGISGALIVAIYRLIGARRPGPVTRGFRRAQIVSAGLLAFAHGANDAQKTIGVITLALIANGTLGANASPPLWTIFAAASAIALGTYCGGWRIMGARGSRIIKMDAAQGFSAQGAGAATILASTLLGFPISTTHAISGGVMGAGAVQAGLGRALGGRRQHRRRLAADPAGCGGDRGRGLRVGQALRHRGTGADCGRLDRRAADHPRPRPSLRSARGRRPDRAAP